MGQRGSWEVQRELLVLSELLAWQTRYNLCCWGLKVNSKGITRARTRQIDGRHCTCRGGSTPDLAELSISSLHLGLGCRPIEIGCLLDSHWPHLKRLYFSPNWSLVFFWEWKDKVLQSGQDFPWSLRHVYTELRAGKSREPAHPNHDLLQLELQVIHYFNDWILRPKAARDRAAAERMSTLHFIYNSHQALDLWAQAALSEASGPANKNGPVGLRRLPQRATSA